MSEELLARFVEEGRELAGTASRGLLVLEREPAARQVLDEVFRAFHTLKGGAAIVGYLALERLLHAAESRLDLMRRGETLADAALVSRLLAAVTHAELWLGAAEVGRDPAESLRETAERLAGELDGKEAAPASAGRPGEPGVPRAAWLAALRDRATALGARTALRYAPATDAFFRGDDPLAILRAVPGLVWMGLQAPAGFGPLSLYAPFDSRLAYLGLSTAPIDAVGPALRMVADEVALVAIEPAGLQAQRRTLRVAAEQVEAIGNLLDDLIVARNALWNSLQDEGRAIRARGAALDRTILALHGAVASLRLAPLGPVLGSVAVQARSLAAALGKALQVEVTGEEVSVDKAMIDGLSEPLLHLARNAVDHGIESAAERDAAGKASPGILRLRAVARGGEAVVELQDDGRGIDLERVRRTAVERGLVDAAGVRALGDEAALDLVFAPGFSTAVAVTEVSGRGVGLDAVRAAITRLGGRVTLETAAGRGTTARIAVPIHAVLMRVAVVCAGGERFGLPVSDIREVRRLRASDITTIRLGRAILHRDEVVPVVRLAELVGLEHAPRAAETAIIIGEGDDQVALSVEDLGERLEAPMRPLWGPIARLPGIQGSLVEGDGRVLMVLDVAELLA